MNLLYNILNAIILSLISATIFWLFFSYLPKRKRIKKIRPKVNQDLESITRNLYETFKTILRNSNKGNYTYYRKILNGTLNKEDIELGLQNKCYDIKKLEDFQFKYLIISIGQDIEKFKILILKKIDELYFFSEFLSANEIITLERIKKMLNHQNLDTSSRKNLTHFTDHFNDLYQLYVKLDEITFNENKYYIQTNEFYDINFPLRQIDYYFYSKKDFKKCKQVLKEYIKNFPSTKIFKFRLIMCEYELGNINKGYRLFKIFLKDVRYITHYSNYMNILKKYDNRIIPYLKNTLKKEEYSKIIKSMEKNQNNLVQEEMQFVKTNQMLKEYFRK